MPFSNAGKADNSVDQGGTFRLLLTNLSEAFDCLGRERFIKNLNVCGFNLPALTLSHPQNIRFDLKRFNQRFVTLMVV